MSNVLAIRKEDQQIEVWHESNLAEIKKIYAPTATEKEFEIFCAMGRSTGLSPYLREIWLVKYKDSPAQIFIGRDGYRISAQRNPRYDYHSTDAVYANDKFGVKNGEVFHEYNLVNRGELLGAYGIAARKGSSKPSFVYLDLKEYDQKQSVWNSKKATMIKKVAEAQVLRMTFQEIFAGSYHEYEQYDAEQPKNAIRTNKGIAGLEEKFGLIEDKTAIEGEFDTQTGEVMEAPKSQLSHVLWLLDAASTIDELGEIASKAKELAPAEKNAVRAKYSEKLKRMQA